MYIQLHTGPHRLTHAHTIQADTGVLKWPRPRSMDHAAVVPCTHSSLQRSQCRYHARKYTRHCTLRARRIALHAPMGQGTLRLAPSLHLHCPRSKRLLLRRAFSLCASALKLRVVGQLGVDGCVEHLAQERLRGHAKVLVQSHGRVHADGTLSHVVGDAVRDVEFG